LIVFDQRGHGRTPDPLRAMSYEQFADDAAALLRALDVEHADVMGDSQGGGVALQLALRHPTVVNKLAVMRATYRRCVETRHQSRGGSRGGHTHDGAAEPWSHSGERAASLGISAAAGVYLRSAVDEVAACSPVTVAVADRYRSWSCA
jgi:pimeloyl-ACP methyl ester carboxylesterase